MARKGLFHFSECVLIESDKCLQIGTDCGIPFRVPVAVVGCALCQHRRCLNDDRWSSSPHLLPHFGGSPNDRSPHSRLNTLRQQQQPLYCLSVSIALIGLLPFYHC